VKVDDVIQFHTQFPDAAGKLQMAALEAESPGAMGYFYQQDPEYIILKERFAQQILSGEPGVPEGIASIDTAVEALQVAEYLAPVLAEA